nr:hypothetical protein [uncultured bacterium]
MRGLIFSVFIIGILLVLGHGKSEIEPDKLADLQVSATVAILPTPFRMPELEESRTF